MLTQEQRATMSATWLARWNSWQGSGVSMAEYARREGFIEFFSQSPLTVPGMSSQRFQKRFQFCLGKII
jgi:hypothetical protein